MTTGEWSLITGAAVASYFYLGWWWMKRDLPYAWRRAQIEWPGSRKEQKTHATVQSMFLFVFWWIVGPIREIQRVVIESDPKVLERRAEEAEEARKKAERDRRRMERELDKALDQSREALGLKKKAETE